MDNETHANATNSPNSNQSRNKEHKKSKGKAAEESRDQERGDEECRIWMEARVPDLQLRSPDGVQTEYCLDFH